MIPRILGRSFGQRRHLTVLVGLLIVTFGLTAVLAWQAHRSDLERQRSIATHLGDVAVAVAQDWFERLTFGVDQELVALVNVVGPRAARHPVQALQTLADTLARQPLCRSCAPLTDIPFFAVDGGGEIEARGPPAPADVVAEAWRRVERGEFASAHDSIGVTLLFYEHAGRAGAVAGIVVLDDAERAERLIGFVLPEATAREIVRHAFPRDRTFTLIAKDVDNAELFVASASVAGVRLLGPPGAAPGVTRVVSEGPVWGVELGITVLPAAQGIIAEAEGPPRLPLLLALLFLIGALIVVALLLVRREAELVRLRADFVSSVSHELRTPLAQIRMFTETLLLGRVRTDAERRRSLDIIDQEARRLSELVENVLLFSKSESGRRPRLTPEPTPFAAEVRRAVESFLPMLKARDAELRLELQEDIEAPVDRSALRQIMVNLIDNALKYGPAGQRITVGVALFGSSARVWVDDEGPGIPRGDRERVFESFVRLRRETDSHVGGSGIGLSVVLGLARLHGGAAWAEEAPGGGTRVVVQFPDASLTPPAGVAAAS